MLDTDMTNSYNNFCAEVAQSVEQRTENVTPIVLIERFIASRRDGLSPRTIKNYRVYLGLASEVVGLNVTGQELQRFINTRECTNGIAYSCGSGKKYKKCRLH